VNFRLTKITKPRGLASTRPCSFGVSELDPSFRRADYDEYCKNAPRWIPGLKSNP
jgi:hypothetical protein